MKIWGIVRDAAALLTTKYANNDLKQPNLTVRGNVGVESILVSPGGLVPATADIDDGSVASGQTVALGITENYVYSGVSATWIRQQALLDNSDGQAPLAVGTLGVIARLQGWNGATFDRITAQGDNADGLTVAALGNLAMWSHNGLFNGNTWDRQRSNLEGAALASAVRAVTTVSPDLTNYNGGAAMGWMDVTAVPGVSTVSLSLEGKDPVSGNYLPITAGTAQAGIGTYGMSGATGAVLIGARTPRTFRFKVTHIGGGNFTYSVGYSVVPS